MVEPKGRATLRAVEADQSFTLLARETAGRSLFHLDEVMTPPVLEGPAASASSESPHDGPRAVIRPADGLGRRSECVTDRAKVRSGPARLFLVALPPPYHVKKIGHGKLADRVMAFCRLTSGLVTATPRDRINSPPNQ
jgi:hypothetical protein